MQTGKHTPTPWKVRYLNPEDKDDHTCFIEAPKAEGMAYGLDVCGDDYSGYGHEKQRRVNMEFIVTACNNHNALVEMVKRHRNILNLVATIGDYPDEKERERVAEMVTEAQALISSIENDKGV